jgi:hypothetical protein
VNVDALARALVEEAMEPVRRSLREAEVRMADLERRLAAALAAPAQPAVALLPEGGAVAYVPAARAPAVAPAQLRSVPPAPLLIREALAQDVPLNAADIRPFDGSRRRRRMIVLFVLFLLIVFGGLFAMLAESYMPQR